MADLIEKFSEALRAASKGNRVVTIHLFGIAHAEELRGVNLSEFAERAGAGASFGTELRKGMRLAEFVELRVRTVPTNPNRVVL